MRIALIGVGNAGSKIADEIIRFQEENDRALASYVVAINTARSDLAKLDRISTEKQILVGQTDDRVKGHGVGSDPDLGAEVTRRDLQKVERALDGVPLHEIDAFVVAGLGGGTGSGGAPVLTDRIRDLFDEPVYGLGILPGTDEGGRASFDAARSLQSFVNATDNVLLFDNDSWRGHQDTIEAGYERMNRELATRFGTLLAAGNLDDSAVSENVMDASDVRRTLRAGGISTVAYAEAALESETKHSKGLLGRIRTNGTNEELDTAQKVSGLVRQAVQSRLTCPASVASAKRSLIVISGPPAEFSRKGVESARRWIEEQTDSIEVLAGDDPRGSAETLSAAGILSNVTDIPRVESRQEQAVDAASNADEQIETRDEDMQDLITDDEGTLDPV
ncbi:MAG: tubulin/FtsZ family protein [Halorhabdus sp.]